MTQKILFGIFAHPDDEAFGCAGTLMKETRSGTELHLITLTDGSSGANPDSHSDLGVVRLNEWRAASGVLGAASTHHFGYSDGHLDNVTLLEAADRLEHLVIDTINDRPEVTVEFMTLDLNGITGHIDHIVAARLACLVFYRLKQYARYMHRIRFRCLPESHCQESNTRWLYMEKGRRDDEINEIVDASDYLDEIKQVILLHRSQRNDGEAHLAERGDEIALNYFFVKS